MINHKHLEEKRRRKLAKRHRSRIAIAALAIVPLGFALLYAKISEAPSVKESDRSTQEASVQKKGVLKKFTPQQFRDLYNNFAYPNTEKISDSTPITGNQALDERIRSIAVQRGYALRSAPVTNAFLQVAPDMLLQQRAAQPWLDMQEAANKEGLVMELSAAYRSADEQKQIFLSRFTVRSAKANRVAAGSFDKEITSTLATTAPPGYSRHHTGYTIDIICDNNINLIFERTDCFRWLSADNYKNAKTYGWIPSYPEGTGLQGPEPESWEYVWVGAETLIE